MSEPSGNGWSEWGRHVLRELERLNLNFESIRTDTQELKAKLLNFNPQDIVKIQTEIDSLKTSDHDQELRIRELEKAGQSWAGKEKIVTWVIALLISLLTPWIYMKLTQPPPPPDSSNQKPHSELILPPKRIEDLRKYS